MKNRSSLLLATTVAALSFGALAPAQASDDIVSVTGLQVQGAVQTPGSTLAYTVTASWDSIPSRVTGYTVKVLDKTCDPSELYRIKDVSSASYSESLSSLQGDSTYCLSVTPKGFPLAEPSTQVFDTPAPDVTPPSATYSLDRTSGYLLLNFDANSLDEFESARFVITQKQADSEIVSRKVSAGDGSAVKTWSGGQTFDLSYTKAGNFTPSVTVADQYGNTQVITLPAVHVLADNTPPKLKITKPAKASRIKSWRVIRGTASDKGTGIDSIVVGVMEKRGAYWWAYDSHHHRWLKGSKSRAKTNKHTEAWPLTARLTRNGHWHTATIRGLRAGELYIQALGFDKAYNVRLAHPVTKRVH